MPDLHCIRHTERHVINHGSIEKNLLFKKTRNSPPATSFYSSLSLLLPRNREKKEKKEKKSRGKRSRDVLLISFLLSKIDADIFTSTRYFPAFLRLLWNITTREESLERRERNGARHFLLEPRARIRSVYRMQIDRERRESGSGRTTERRS